MGRAAKTIGNYQLLMEKRLVFSEDGRLAS